MVTASSVRRSSRDKSSTPSNAFALSPDGVALNLLRQVIETEGRIITDPRNKLNDLLVKDGVEFSLSGKPSSVICCTILCVFCQPVDSSCILFSRSWILACVCMVSRVRLEAAHWYSFSVCPTKYFDSFRRWQELGTRPR